MRPPSLPYIYVSRIIHKCIFHATQGTHYVGRVQRKGVACETARILRWVIFEFSNEIVVM